MPKSAKSEAPKRPRQPPPQAILELPDRLEIAMDARKYPPKEKGRYAKLVRATNGTVNPGQVADIVNKNRNKGITAAVVVRLADALDVNAGWLLTGRGSMDGSEAAIIDQLRDLLRKVDDPESRKLLSDK
jgi:hypothetical protein